MVEAVNGSSGDLVSVFAYMMIILIIFYIVSRSRNSQARFIAVIPFISRNWPIILGTAALCKVTLFYIKRYRFPPGPLPFPYVGNLPALAMVGGSFYRAAENWTAIHGDIFTVWIGEKPWIFINSLDAILECNTADTQNLFAGRVRTNTGDVQMQGNVGVIFSDFGVAQQALRSVAQQAMRKYLATRRGRHQIIIDVVDNFLDVQTGKFIESKNVAEELVQCLATITMFGSELEPEKQKELREAHRALESNCPSGLPSDVIPIFKYLLWTRERAGMAAFYRYNAIARELCTRTAENYESKGTDDIDCVMDAVLHSVKEPTSKGRQGEEYLTPGNVSQIVFDLFEAGSQTSVITLNWALLKLASDQEIQEVLYNEINTYVEDQGRLPSKKDKRTLPRLQSFLKEVLRFWPAAPFGLPRKLLETTRIRNIKLPANSTILFNLCRGNRDTAYWTDGGTFNPERFLDKDGLFDERHHRGFLTFGVGSRACLGTMLAIENLYFILARVIQRCRILPSESGISLSPFPAALMLDAKIQNIKLEARN